MPRKSPAKLEVRTAIPSDIPGILALISRAYPGAENYSAGQVRGQVNNFPEGQFVAVLVERPWGGFIVSEATALHPNGSLTRYVDMLTGKQCRQKASHCRHMAESLVGYTATNLAMLAAEYDKDGRLADLAAALIPRGTRLGSAQGKLATR